MRQPISTFTPTTASIVYVYCDGACMQSSYGNVAGYGVYTQSNVYNVSICEPLPAGLQTSQRAEVKGLSCALELVWGMRPRKTVIICDSEYVTRGYNEWMNIWKINGWRKSDGAMVAHVDLWKHIIKYPDNIDFRRMKLEVRWKERNVTQGQIIADQLAKQGCGLNYLCQICQQYIGREGMSHNCRPTCRRDDCDGRIFADAMAYKQHLEYRHGNKTKCRRYGCDMVFGSKMAAESHEDMVHGGYVFDCDYCNVVYRSEEDKDDHETEECDYAPYCRQCDRWFVFVGARDQHRRDYHGWYY